jgi:putative DNA methylase
MAIFSRHAGVIESDGARMSVRAALARINEILDQVLGEQEGDFDAATRFALAWYRQHGYGVGAFGDADNLARARNTAVETMDLDGVLTSRAGKVALIRPGDLDPGYDIAADAHVSVWEAAHHLIRVLETAGVGAAADLLRAAIDRVDDPIDADLVKELAFLAFSIAEKNGWAKDALAFNTLATSWPEIAAAARAAPAAYHQDGFDLESED